MASFRIVTERLVQTVVEQEFWVQAETADEATEILEDSNFTHDEDGLVEVGDETYGDSETENNVVVDVEEEKV